MSKTTLRPVVQKELIHISYEKKILRIKDKDKPWLAH